jgi:hypothetical protein
VTKIPKKNVFCLGDHYELRWPQFFFPPGGEETNEKKKGKKKVASLAMGVVVRMPWLFGERQQLTWLLWPVHLIVITQTKVFQEN